MSQINIPRKKEQIKKIWKEHFRRILTDEEIESRFNKSITSSNKILSLVQKTSIPLIENQINSADNIYFSPSELMQEIKKSVDAFGDKFIDDTKFAEEYTAVQFSLAIRKLNGDKLLIGISDKPDFTILKIPFDKLGKNDDHMKSLEVLKCAPEVEGFRDGYYDEDFLEYIKDKKFSKEYGNSWLISPFFSNKYKGEILKDFSKKVSSQLKIPFENIFLTELIGDNYGHFILYRIYPDYFSIEVNLVEDKHLIRQT